MKIAPCKGMLPLKFGTNKNFRDEKDNSTILNKKVIYASAPDIQGIYSRAFLDMQPDMALFDKTIFNLSSSFEGLSDEEFNSLKINQTFEKDDFIVKTLSIIEDLPEADKRTVCSYFGFELYENEENPAGFSILGYPYISSDEKVIQNSNTNVLGAINKLRPEVERFVSKNPIICNDKEIEKELNSIVAFFPELRVLIGKKQHKNHSFDVMKHSLKVMQKTVQNAEFENLNKQDKRLMLLASLFHDIRKTEGKRDPNHAINGALDAYKITKRLNLPHGEATKLFSLIKNHRWLNVVNRCSTIEEEQEAQKAAAFDMREGNLFNLMKIFTEADLKSTKDSDASFNKHKERFEAHLESISRHIGLMYQCL